MRFICPKHGEVKAAYIRYSLPAVGRCPVCNRKLSDADRVGVSRMRAKEARDKRPDYRQS